MKKSHAVLSATVNQPGAPADYILRRQFGASFVEIVSETRAAVGSCGPSVPFTAIPSPWVHPGCSAAELVFLTAAEKGIAW